MLPSRMRKQTTHGKRAARCDTSHGLFPNVTIKRNEINASRLKSPERIQVHNKRNRLIGTSSYSPAPGIQATQLRSVFRPNGEDLAADTVFDISISEDESLNSMTSSPPPSTISSGISSYSTLGNNLKRKRTHQVDVFRSTTASPYSGEDLVANKKDITLSKSTRSFPIRAEHPAKQRKSRHNLKAQIEPEKHSLKPSGLEHAAESALPTVILTQRHKFQTHELGDEANSKSSLKLPNENGRGAGIYTRQKAKAADTASPLVQYGDENARSQLQSRDLEESPEPSSRSTKSPIRTPRHASPNEAPRTPRTTRRVEERLSRTPNERQQWSRLLDVTQYESPSLVMGKLSLDNAMQSDSEFQESLIGRKKLVDALRGPQRGSSSTQNPHIRPDESVNFEDQHVGLTELSQRSTKAAIKIPRHVSHVKITYAKQRSYVAEPLSSLEDYLKQPLGHDTLSGQVSMDIDGSDTENAPNGMMNIHELRAAGDSERFNDSINSFLEEMSTNSPSTTSSRRSSMLHFTSKLNDVDFLKRVVHNGHDVNILSQSGREHDVIFVFALAATALFMLQDGLECHAYESIYRSDLLNHLEIPLRHTTQITYIAKQRQTNMSKANQQLVQQISKNLQDVVFPSFPISDMNPQIVALKLIEHVVRECRQNGNQEIILGQATVNELLDILLSTTKSDSMNVSHSENVINSILSTLESFTVAAVSTSDVWDATMRTCLVNSMEFIVKSRNEFFRKYNSLLYRICLNMSNNNEVNSEEFARKDFICFLFDAILEGLNDMSVSRSDSNNLMRFDDLILALGATINLAEMSTKVRDMVYHYSTSQVCQILQAFVTHQSQTSHAQSLGQSRANVAYGYVAVLTSNLCIDERLRNIVRGQLPGKNLQSLIAAVDEFVLYHKVADKKEEGNNQWIAFTQRLQSLADSLRLLEA